MGPPNGTAYVPLQMFSGAGTTTARVLYHSPPVHWKVFNVQALEIAILCSHLRATGKRRRA